MENGVNFRLNRFIWSNNKATKESGVFKFHQSSHVYRIGSNDLHSSIRKEKKNTSPSLISSEADVTVSRNLAVEGVS